MPAKKGATEEAKTESKKTKAEEKPKKKEEESEDMGEEEEDMEEEEDDGEEEEEYQEQTGGGEDMEEEEDDGEEEEDGEEQDDVIEVYQDKLKKSYSERVGVPIASLRLVKVPMPDVSQSYESESTIDSHVKRAHGVFVQLSFICNSSESKFQCPMCPKVTNQKVP